MQPLVILSRLARKNHIWLWILEEIPCSEVLILFFKVFLQFKQLLYSRGGRAQEPALCSNMKYWKQSGAGGHLVYKDGSFARDPLAGEHWVYFSALRCSVGLHKTYLGGSGHLCADPARTVCSKCSYSPGMCIQHVQSVFHSLRTWMKDSWPYSLGPLVTWPQVPSVPGSRVLYFCDVCKLYIGWGRSRIRLIIRVLFKIFSCTLLGVFYNKQDLQVYKSIKTLKYFALLRFAEANVPSRLRSAPRASA